MATLPTTTSTPVDITKAISSGGLTMEPTTPAPNSQSTSLALTPGQFGGAIAPTPPKTPTPVVSTDLAQKQIDQAKTIVAQPTTPPDYYDKVTGELTAAGKAKGMTPMSGGKPIAPTAPTPTVTPPPTEKKTAEDIQIDEIQHPGEEEQYNIATGLKEWVAPGTAGYTKTDPNQIAKAYTGEADPGGGITIRKVTNPDGTDGYIRWNTTTGMYAGTATQSDFADAKNIQSTKTEISNLKAGIYNAEQQSQLDAIEKDFDNQIAIANDFNDSMSKGIVGARTFSGISYINQESGLTTNLQKGIQFVASLVSAKQSSIAKMKQAFLADDVAMLNSAYNDFSKAQTAIQAGLDKIQEDLKVSKEKQDLIKKQLSITELFSSGVTDPIDIMKEMGKKGLGVSSKEVGDTLNVLEKASADAEKKQTDVWNAAQNLGDYKTASLVMALDPRSPTFEQDLKKLQGGLKAKATQAEKDSYELSRTYNLLNNSAGPDNYVDPYDYLKIRAQSNLSASDFNARFGHFVNPATGEGQSVSSKELVGLTEKKTEGFNLTPTFETELIKKGVDIKAYQSDPEYRAAVNSKLE